VIRSSIHTGKVVVSIAKLVPLLYKGGKVCLSASGHSHELALGRTCRMNVRRHLWDVLGKNHSETTDIPNGQHNIRVIDKSSDGSRRDHSLFQVPVNVTVEEPRARVVRLEPDRHIIAITSHAHNVPNDGVIIVVGVIARATDNVERVAVQVYGVLQRSERP